MEWQISGYSSYIYVWDIRGIHIPNSNHGNHIFAQFTVPLLEQLCCACTIETSYSHSPEPISNSSSINGILYGWERNIRIYLPLVLFMAKNPSGLPDVMRYVIFCCGSLSPSSAVNCNTLTPAGLLSGTDG